MVSNKRNQRAVRVARRTHTDATSGLDRRQRTRHGRPSTRSTPEHERSTPEHERSTPEHERSTPRSARCTLAPPVGRPRESDPHPKTRGCRGSSAWSKSSESGLPARCVRRGERALSCSSVWAKSSESAFLRGASAVASVLSQVVPYGQNHRKVAFLRGASAVASVIPGQPSAARMAPLGWRGTRRGP
jgi:hypothetical protein